ncbi:hypothetical protein [Streptomyces collinus]|uniref:hypothetical protein n=1 Tax=Streptomyces collinus TaxID=42684 RepID=UPI00332E3413
MRRSLSLGLVSGLAAAVIPLAAGPASAVEYSNSCNVIQLVHFVPTATGMAHVEGNWDNATTMDPVVLLARDTQADGHHVGARLVTWQADGDVHYWPWHHYYGGDGGQDYWQSKATDSQGIKYAAVEGGVFEGDSLLSECFSSKMKNPTW